jgi:hypothetical protein
VHDDSIYRPVYSGLFRLLFASETVEFVLKTVIRFNVGDEGDYER